MLKYKWFLLFMCIEKGISMLPEEINKDLPQDYKDVIPYELVKCAHFIAEGDIQNAVKMKKKYYENRGDTLNQAEEDDEYECLANWYNQLSNIYSPRILPFPSGYTSKDYILEACLNFFWYNY